MNKGKFTFGDTVRIRRTAPAEYRPGHVAAICWVDENIDEGLARATGFDVGANIYLVEFADGQSIYVEERMLESTRTE